jgi:hypothetical protein
MKTKLLLLIAFVFTAININAQVSLIGAGATGDWGVDYDLTDTDNDGIWNGTAVPMAGGEFKFRLNHAWDTAWGNGNGQAIWPAGTADTAPGVNNNIVSIAGVYDVTFNVTTGEFAFTGGAPLPVVKIVGTAVTTAGGIVMNLSGTGIYSITNTTLVAGNAQFDVDGVLYGGTAFPTGSALSNTDLIPVTAAFYSTITINIVSGEYNFVTIPPVSIVGDAVGGWPTGAAGEVDVNQMSSTDGINYKLDKLACTVGSAKFRQDNGWSVNWGNAAFPTGTATQGGDNVAVSAAGTYDVTFNRVTGVYNFSFPTIALVGAATPSGWPSGAAGEVDATALTTTDGVTYTATNVALTADQCKFRANNAWSVNWGNPAFPSGTATQGGDNIVVATAGNYDVTLNRVTGAYNFTTTMSVNQFGETSFSLVPNPTKGMFAINADVAKAEIFNITGQLVKTFNNAAANESLSISELNQGVYFVKVTDLNLNVKTIKLIKE